MSCERQSRPSERDCLLRSPHRSTSAWTSDLISLNMGSTSSIRLFASSQEICASKIIWAILSHAFANTAASLASGSDETPAANNEKSSTFLSHGDRGLAGDCVGERSRADNCND